MIALSVSITLNILLAAGVTGLLWYVYYTVKSYNTDTKELLGIVERYKTISAERGQMIDMLMLHNPHEEARPTVH